jgi:hypothetical protein
MKNFFVQSFALAFIIAFNIQAAPMACDTAACPKAKIRSHHFVGGGAMKIDPDKLNSSLANNGLSAFDNMAGTFTMGKQSSVKRLIWEKELTLSGWKHNLNSNTRSTLSAGSLLWNTGFNVLNPELPFAVFPYAGAGIGFNTIRFRTESKSMTDVLTYSEKESNVQLWQAALLLNVGLGADFTFAPPDRSKGIVIGVRGGYLFDPITDKIWRDRHTEVNGLSALERSGPYARLVVGMWKHHEKRCDRSDKKCPMQQEKTTDHESL